MHFIWLLAASLSSSLALSRMPKDSDPVIVVGGGLAGLSAAIEIVNQGGKVILIDSQKDVGGNSAKASSGINGCGTAAQKQLNIDDSTDKFYADTVAAGDRENNPSLVDVLVHESAESVQFLIDHGVNLMDINLCGGHSVPRTHWIPSPKEGKPMPVGVAIIRALKQKLLDLQAANPDAVTIKLETEVYGLVTWNDYITGVNVAQGGPKREEINGKAVILATGGYSNDHEKDSLLAEFAPKMVKFPTTNGPFAKGSGVKIARAMGAQLIDMQYVQVHPTAFIDPAQPADRTKFLAAEALRGKGAILLNDKGVRFGNELGRRDYLTERILEDCALDKEANAKVAYMIMNEEAVQGFGPPAFNFYWNIKKFFERVDNVAELAKRMGADEAKVKASLTAYNEAAESGGKDKFGKTVFPVKFKLDEAFYVAKVTPANHYTMGGLKITRDAKVLSEDSGEPFNGLYAAGEVTGGVHGKNRLAGNSLLECVVFGRIAGRNAANLRYSNHHEL